MLDGRADLLDSNFGRFDNPLLVFGHHELIHKPVEITFAESLNLASSEEVALPDDIELR